MAAFSAALTRCLAVHIVHQDREPEKRGEKLWLPEGCTNGCSWDQAYKVGQVPQLRPWEWFAKYPLLNPRKSCFLLLGVVSQEKGKAVWLWSGQSQGREKLCGVLERRDMTQRLRRPKFLNFLPLSSLLPGQGIQPLWVSFITSKLEIMCAQFHTGSCEVEIQQSYRICLKLYNTAQLQSLISYSLEEKTLQKSWLHQQLISESKNKRQENKNPWKPTVCPTKKISVHLARIWMPLCKKNWNADCFCSALHTFTGPRVSLSADWIEV